MTEEEKKKINPDSLYERFRTTQPLTELYDKITTRPAFSYDVGTDPLYQQYRDRYTQLGQQSMRDTMGQAAALTGGYGNTYAQSVGQQTYDRYMQGLTDKIPELYSAAYSRWQDEGNKLAQQYSMARDIESTAYSRQQDAYSRLYSLIGSTGYQPTDDELAAAGMPREIANRLRTMALMKNDELAYIDASGNYVAPPAPAAPIYYAPAPEDEDRNTLASDVIALKEAGVSSKEINRFIAQSTAKGGEYEGTTAQEKAKIRDKIRTLSR